MIKNNESFLKEVALDEELKDNMLSLVFAFNPSLDISKRERFAEIIFPFYSRYKLSDREMIVNDVRHISDLEKWEGRDLRIKKLKIKNLRGFDNPVKPYGIDFMNEEGQPRSMIILGGNGYGKSSVYSSLEYVYCKKVGEAQLRTEKDLQYNAPEYGQFLSHFHESFLNAFCVVDTMSDTLQLHGLNIPEAVRDKINPQTHFISDCDIYSYCKLDYNSGNADSFHNIVAHSLGLKELLDFEKHLNVFIAYSRRTELTKISALEKAMKQDEELLQTNQLAILSKQEQIKTLQTSSEQSKEKVSSNASKLLPAVKQRSFDFWYDHSKLNELVVAFLQAYSRLLGVADQGIGLTQSQFLKLGLELSKTSEDCPLCNSSKKSKAELLLYLEEKLEQMETYSIASQEANKYLNFVTEKLDELVNSLALFKNKITAEFNEIKGQIEFSELTLRHNEISLLLDSILGHEFFAIINGRKENPKFISGPHGFFESLFSVSSDFITNNLKECIDTLSTYGETRSGILREIEKAIISKPEMMSVSEELAVLQNEVKNLAKQNDDLKRRMESNKSEVISLRLVVSKFNKVKDDAREFVAVYHNRLNKEVQSAFKPIHKIVTEVLNEYLQRELRGIELDISIVPEEMDEETGEVFSEIIVARVSSKDRPSESYPVNKYFNSFHYRLFATMVGISVAIASRIKTKINLPLVLDDIFYASDFENRISIEGFLEHIFKTFEHFTPNMPLQVIMFTHDQLIFESIIRVTPSEEKRITFAKMFPMKEAKEKEDYFDLVYKYPYHLSQSIINNLIKSYVA